MRAVNVSGLVRECCVNYLFPYKLFVCLLVLLVLPSFLFVATAQSSLAFGLLVSSFFLILTLWRGVLSVSLASILSFLALFFFILIDSFSSFYSFGVLKPIVSLSIIFPMLVSFLLYKELRGRSFDEVVCVLFVLFCFLVLIGVVKFFYIPDFLGYNLRPKSVFPFSEESHYALALGVVALSLTAGSSFKVGLGVVSILFVLSVLYPSLTLLVFSFLGLFVLSLRYIVFFFCSLGVSLVIASFLLSHEYFSTRLDFENSGNLTTLVFVQGVELIRATLSVGLGGVGFQMLGGPDTPSLDVSESIYIITGRYMNLDDGGFLAAKIISEFGLLGVGLILFYILVLAKSLGEYLFCRQCHAHHVPEEWVRKVKLATGAWLALFVEIFLRGYGYFSPTLFFVLAFLPFLLLKLRRSGDVS